MDNNKNYSGAEIMFTLCVKYNGDWNSIYEHIKNKSFTTESDFEAGRLALADSDVKFVSIISPDYPESLKKIYKPPFGIFYKGDLSLLNSNSVGLLGDKLYKNHIDVINDVFSSAYRGNTPIVLSTNNPDDIVNRINNGNIMVLPDNLVGMKLNNFGLILSERLTVSSSTDTMGWMMRVQAGLSSNLLFTGTKKKGSASVIGVGYALYLNKNVLVLPSSKVTSTNTKLISDGATVFTDPVALFKFDDSSSASKSMDA